MPQTINARVCATITCAANDLVTINIAGDNQNAVYFKNTGPGKAYLSFDPTVPAAVGNANCLILATGDTYTRTHVLRNQAITLNADTASTVVAMAVNPYP